MSQEGDIKAEHLEAVDALATKLLLDSVYAPNATFATPQSTNTLIFVIAYPWMTYFSDASHVHSQVVRRELFGIS